MELFRQIPNTRLSLPLPLMAWVMIVGGALLIALGTLCAMRVRAYMWGETRGFLQAILNDGRSTLGYLLHDYDEPDKPLMLLGLALRFPAAIVLLWGVAGLVWT